MSELASSEEVVVRMDLDLGSFELGTGECRELIRWLERRGSRPGGRSAYDLASRLESLLERDDATLTGSIGEDELDTVADAAWEWLERDGLERFPERVLVLLDVVRSRRAHD